MTRGDRSTSRETSRPSPLVAPAASPPARPLVYLEPGTVHWAGTPTTISTILGSCVAVCLWDGRTRLGGMNHFMLPRWDGRSPASPRYGDLAIDQLLSGMTGMGCRIENIVAKVFGGAEVLPSGPDRDTIGRQNVRQAMLMLSERRIGVAAEHTGGNRGLSIKFATDSGDVLLRLVRRSILSD